ncbi:MAG TPA: AsnC family protein [Acetobacteraceae bacterium]|jgi:hypothetical protein|nr:AsnC family protein [Acetobacteraceae bacterium]
MSRNGQRRPFTEAEDETIRRMRAAGEGWDVVAQAVGCSRWAAQFRGVRCLGLPSKLPVAAAPEPAEEDDYDRREDGGAKPAGHPVTWGLITAGTCLAGSSFREAG